MDKAAIKEKLASMSKGASDSSSASSPETPKSSSQLLSEYNARKAKRGSAEELSDAVKAKQADMKAIKEGKQTDLGRTQSQTDSLVASERSKWKANIESMGHKVLKSK